MMTLFSSSALSKILPSLNLKDQRARILVNEQDEHTRELVCATLAKNLYLVDCTQTSDEIFTQLAWMRHQLLIVGLNAQTNYAQDLELLQELKRMAPAMPFLVLSSSHAAEFAVAVMRLGAFDCLFKPIGEERLLASVQDALEKQLALIQRDAYQQALEKEVASRTRLLRQALNELEQTCDFTLEALGDSLDLKDSETQGHSRRVTAYSVALARAMNLSNQTVKTIARGAFLHDIGKIAIPDAILRKPGPLTEGERASMRTHCERGYHLLRKIPFLAEPSEIVYAHQEFYDGSGYPRGLKGEEIHLGARIFSIADTLDAITSDRPYRAAKSFAQARQEILRCAGSQFDPQVVQTYLEIPDAFWSQLRSDISSSALEVLSLTDQQS